MFNGAWGKTYTYFCTELHKAYYRDPLRPVPVKHECSQVPSLLFGISWEGAGLRVKGLESRIRKFWVMKG